MPGPITAIASPANDGQTERTVEAGTVGRLIRVCMAVAREDPTWEAVGPVLVDESVLRQKLQRRRGAPEDVDYFAKVMSEIADKLTAELGAQCVDYEIGCVTCAAWRAFDDLSRALYICES